MLTLLSVLSTGMTNKKMQIQAQIPEKTKPFIFFLFYCSICLLTGKNDFVDQVAHYDVGKWRKYFLSNLAT